MGGHLPAETLAGDRPCRSVIVTVFRGFRGVNEGCKMRSPLSLDARLRCLWPAVDAGGGGGRSFRDGFAARCIDWSNSRSNCGYAPTPIRVSRFPSVIRPCVPSRRCGRRLCAPAVRRGPGVAHYGSRQHALPRPCGVLFLEEAAETGAHSTATGAVCPVRTLAELLLGWCPVASGKQQRRIR
jgi:hypothetical protein